MKYRFFYFFVILMSSMCMSQTPFNFNDYFINKTMRIDYFHVGDASQEFITIDQIYMHGIWAGSKRNLIDDFNNGRYYAKVFDSVSGKLIFSKGFDSYFGEYKTTDPALRGIKRTYHESMLIPYPKEKIRFTLEARNKKNIFHCIFSQEIDPNEISIIKEPVNPGVKVFEIVKSGEPHKKVDMALIAEGYTTEEEDKAKKDFERYTEALFSIEPFITFSKKFNIYGVFKPSVNSGCDEPRGRIFKNTILNSSFNALGLARYLLTEDNKALRDIAAHVPYDALVIIVNSKRYGGGGIYNFYCIFTSDDSWSKQVFLHEFGHSFAGLADEYYSSSVSYNEFYPKGIEPTEPNITALLDPKNLKWKKFVSPGIEIPTPWEKEKYDKLSNDYQKLRQELNTKLAKMKKEGASEAAIEETKQQIDKILKEHSQRMDDFLFKSPYSKKVGAFEGAGYSPKGLYRPMLHCLMFKNIKGHIKFCRVCEQAIIQLIRHYSK